MPVVGHAFAGIVVAHEYTPGGRRNPRPPRVAEEALWTPALVALQYFPDAVAAVLSRFGATDPLLASHSIPIGSLAGLLFGVGGALLTRRSPILLASLAIGSIVGHDVLDLFQATDRAPFWPFTMWSTGARLLMIPDRVSGELLVFGPLFLCYAVWRWLMPAPGRDSHISLRSSRAGWIARALVVALVLMPLVAYYTRRAAERQIRKAQSLLRSGRFLEALSAADDADRWSWVVRRGRTDLVRGEAYEALGDDSRAEIHYLRAYRLDGNNFWAVADLAEYYASHGAPATRPQRARPYLDDLRKRFAGHPALGQVVARVETQLERSN